MIFLIILVSIKSTVFAHYFDFPDVQLTTVVKPHSKECFYQYADILQDLRMEFQVIDAGISSQDLKIAIIIRSPSGRKLLKEITKSREIRRMKIRENGDYEICFDNTFSVLSSKTVYFEISTEVETEKQRLAYLGEIRDTNRSDSLSILRKTAKIVRENLDKVKHFQDTFRAVEARDINIQEKNFVKVNTFSSLTVVLMMLFAFLHLLVLKCRSLAIAKNYHESLLLMESYDQLANSRTNPPVRYIYHIHENWLAQNSESLNSRTNFNGYSALIYIFAFHVFKIGNYKYFSIQNFV